MSSKVLCCNKKRKPKDMIPCLWCNNPDNLYCPDCYQCKTCQEYNPGSRLCGESGKHEILPGEEAGTCVDCDEKYRTCMRHLRRCETCNATLCKSSEHQCPGCRDDTYVCRACGFIPSIAEFTANDIWEGGNHCSKHWEEAAQTFATRLENATNARLKKKIKLE